LLPTAVVGKLPRIMPPAETNAAIVASESQPGLEDPLSHALRTALAFTVSLAGILFITSFTHWYEVVVFQNASIQQVIINSLAPLVMFLLFLLVGVVNPLLRRFAPSCAFGGRELFLVASLWLITGVICYLSLTAPVVHHAGNAFNPALEQPMMKRVEFTKYLNPALFLPVDATKDYYYGKSDGTKRIALESIPWHLWWRPLAFWVPLIVAMIVLSMAVVRITHRQWSRHELLSYPIAEAVRSLFARDTGRSFPAIFYNQIFWGGFFLIFTVYLVNGLALWFPKMISIPLSFAHSDLIKKFPFLSNYCGREAYSLFRGMLYPFIVCIAVLLPAEVSLTCWLGWVLMIFATGVYFLGTGEVIGQAETEQMQAGMFVAMLVVIVFIGRREYLNVLRHAFTRRKTEDTTLAAAVKACRGFVIAFLTLVVLLVIAGLDWFIALVAVSSFSLVVVLTARMTAEIGIPWLVNFNGVAASLPLKLLGSAAMGPQGIAVMAVVGAVMGYDTTNTIAAQETTRGKLAETQLGRGGGGAMRLLLPLGVAVALASTLLFTLWDNYSFGSRQEQSMSKTLRQGMDTASADINRLQIEGKIEEATNATGFGRVALAKSQPNFWRFFCYGAAIVGVCAFLRLRFTWWPFHPLPLLLLNTWCLSRLFFSFLIGWLIKIALVRIGGGKVFTASKPFFLGVIVGQVVITVLWILVGAIYYRVTRTQPPPISFFL
jgi:hypothetical protein